MAKAESPFLIVNPKSYLYGEKSLELAKAADKTAKVTGLQIYFTCAYADIRLIKENTENLIVCAQSMDSLTPGRGMGHVLPESLKEAGAGRVLPLKVSGPFHSPMMRPAGEELAKVFAGVSMNPLKIPYVANINAEVITDCGRIEGLLVDQVSGSVRWQQSVETMIREWVDTFVEIGPGKTLTGFLRKIDKNVKAYHIGSWEEAVQVCEELK